MADELNIQPPAPEQQPAPQPTTPEQVRDLSQTTGEPVPEWLAELDINDPADEAPAAQQPAAAAPPVQQEQQPAFPPQLLQRAQQLGIPEADARAFEPAHLERSLSLLERQQAQFAQWYLSQQNQPAPAQQRPGQQPPGQQQQPQPAEEAPTLGEEWDPTIRQLHAHHNKEIQQLKMAMGHVLAENQRFRQREQQEATSSWEQRFDGWINQLPEDYVPVLGRGNGAELQRGSQEFNNRIRLLNAAETILAGYRATQQQVPQEMELYQQALHLAFGPQAGQFARTQAVNSLNEQIRDQRGRFVARPTHRNGPALATAGVEQVAQRNLRSRMRDMGLDPGPDTDPDYEGIPD